MRLHPRDEAAVLDHYLDPRHASSTHAAAAPAKSPPPPGRIDYHVFLDTLGRDVTAAQPLFGEMFAHDASVEAARNIGKTAAANAAKAQVCACP